MSVAQKATGGEWAQEEPPFELHEVLAQPRGAEYETKYPIPLEHRLYYIEEEPWPDYYPLPEDIAEELGVTVEWVELTAEELGIEELEVGGYPQYALPVLKQEYEWQQAYLAEGETVSRSKIEDLVGMPQAWVKDTLVELGYEPFQIVKVKGSATKHLYVKTASQNLRAKKMSIRPAGSWPTRYELMMISGWTWSAVDNFLQANGFEPQERRSKAGNECAHYAPNSKKALQAELEANDGSWYTKAEMCRLLGHNLSHDWLNKRLEPYKNEEVILRDVLNRPEPHYPEWVFRTLMANQAKEQIGLEHMTDRHMSVYAVAVASHRVVETVRRILKYLGEPIVVRIDPYGSKTPSCEADLLEIVTNFDTILLEDKMVLARSVSQKRTIVRTLEEQVQAKAAAIKVQKANGTLSAEEMTEYNSLKYETRKARMRLGNAACRYDVYLAAEKKHRTSQGTQDLVAGDNEEE